MLTLVVNNNATQAQTYKQIENHYRQNFEKLIPRYTHFLKSKERAEDVVQDAYLRACTYWPDAPSDPTEFSKWFHIVLGNALKDNHREEIMKGANNSREAEDEGAEGPAIPAIIYKQVVDRIKAKPSGQAKVLSLALLHHYRANEIADMVPESAVAIRKIVSRFRKEINQEFGWKI